MSTISWYKVCPLSFINDSGLVIRELSMFFGVLGQKTVTITKGNLVSILFDDIFLSLNLNDKNPFVFENYCLFIDNDDDIWVGVLSS